MVTSCCAYGCKEVHSKGGPYTFHSFPKNEFLRKLWVLKVRRENFTASTYTKLCSKHFEEDCFDREKFGGTWLKKDAVPTLFDFSPPLQTRKDTRKSLMRKIDISTPLSDQAQKTFRYIGDFEEADMTSPSKAREVLFMARKSQKEVSLADQAQKTFRYIGDFEEADMTSPSKAREVLFMARKSQKEHRQKIQNLQRKSKRSENRIASLKKILKEVKNKPRITDSASTVWKRSVASEKSNPSFEPEVVIKEEPIEFHEGDKDSQQPSCSHASGFKEEFVLPYGQSGWTPTDDPSTSGLTPSLGEVYSIADFQANLEESEGRASTNSNGKHKASTTSKAKKSALELKEDVQSKRQRENNVGESAINASSVMDSNSTNDRPKDQFDAYGEYIAAKLRKLDWKSCAYVQKAIGDIIFEAEMGKYSQVPTS